MKTQQLKINMDATICKKKYRKIHWESQAHSANDLHLFNADADCKLKVELNALF